MPFSRTDLIYVTVEVRSQIELPDLSTLSCEEEITIMSKISGNHWRFNRSPARMANGILLAYFVVISERRCWPDALVPTPVLPSPLDCVFSDDSVCSDST